MRQIKRFVWNEHHPTRAGKWFGILLLLFVLFLMIPVTRFNRPVSTVLLDRDGELLCASIAGDEQWRFPEIEHTPDKFAKAAICFEDKRFYRHPGVDAFALIRAIRDNVKQREIVSGASTLTMQVIRLSRPGAPRSFWEKGIEMLLALRLEFARSKEEILSLYASHAPFGGNVVGLEAASWRYFGRRPEHLSWAETAMLAVLPNNPALIHPGKNRELLLEKRNLLLDKMLQEKILDSISCALAKEEPLPEKPYPLPMLAPHLHQRISMTHHSKTKSRYRTTLDKSLQMRASEVVQRHHEQLTGNGINNAAALILDVETGGVLAYVGNVRDTSGEFGQFVDVITSPRSTGSLLKPFLYASMLDDGEIVPNTLVPDIPTRMGGFRPENYSRTYEGAVPACKALARSLNVPAVRMLREYGVARFYHKLKSLGMSTLFRSADDYGLSLILGGAEGTLWEMASMYVGMARCLNQFFNEGVRAESGIHFLSEDASHPRMETDFPLSPAACWLTFQAMLDVSRPEEDREWQQFSSSQNIAWKTGTSYGFRDGWAIGVTPRYAVGVWTGNADGEGRPGLTGLTTAAPILFDLFDLLDPSPWFQCPESELVRMEVCAQSGYRKTMHCESAVEILAPRAGLNLQPCPYCRTIHCDSTKTWRVNSECEAVSNMANVSWFVLPPAMEWFYKQKHPEYHALPPFRPDCIATDNESPNQVMTLLQIDSDGENTFFIPTELDGQKSKVVFEATHRDPDCILFWHLDDEYITSTQGIHQVALSPAKGVHKITVVDENGTSISREFEVLNP